jgi:glucan phosphoethanolaminetransferase (alkaline phosphatase superfamily)
MIQRLQSLFLFLASGGFLGQFATDLAKSSNPIANLMKDGIYEVQDNPILLGITILGGLIPLIAIFLFKNRKLQSSLSMVSIALAALLPIIAFFLIYNESNGILQDNTVKSSLGSFLPILPLIFSILAKKYVDKDEKLVRSMDRLR